MKKFFVVFLLLVISFNSFSQTCEEREKQLLSLMAGVSAGFLYNTYGLIGSIADGYEHTAYEPEMVTDLLEAQKKMIDNMTGLLEKMVEGNFFKNQSDKDYILSVKEILKGFKIQADLLVVVVNSGSRESREAYDEQRNRNWKAISKLMGIKE